MRDRQPLRFGAGELVKGDEFELTERSAAWTQYLLAAAQIEPGIITSLITDESLEALQRTRELHERWVHNPEWSDMPVPPRPDDPLDRLIRAWCDRWGLRAYFSSIPAHNLVVEAKRRRTLGEPDPQTFTCDCAGVPLDPSEPGPWRRIAAVSMSDPLTGRWEQISGIGSGARLNLDLPELTWNPREETLPWAQARIMAVIKPIVASELDHIRDDYMASGYKPVLVKRETRHFEWLARFQVLREDKTEIARTEGLEERHVRRALTETARLLGMELRSQRRGRPRRRTGRTVTVRAPQK